MNSSKGLDSKPIHIRALTAEQSTPALHQQTCLRCGKRWWPRLPHKPKRCPACKSPYWNRPRRIRSDYPRGSLETVKKTLRQALTKALRGEPQTIGNDRSLAKALEVLKAMKAAGKTWQEMGERIEQDFGTTLEKDQLKALVR